MVYFCKVIQKRYSRIIANLINEIKLEKKLVIPNFFFRHKKLFIILIITSMFQKNLILSEWLFKIFMDLQRQDYKYFPDLKITHLSFFSREGKI